jgi:hypothetical protein
MAKKSESYKLKDPQTTFYDPETKFKVVGDQASELGPKGRGKLTAAAIIAGGLIEVGMESKTGKEADAKDAGGKDDDKPKK